MPWRSRRGSVPSGQVPSNGTNASTTMSTAGSPVHAASRASPFGSITTQLPTRSTPSGPGTSPGSVNCASTRTPTTPITPATSRPRQGTRAGPTWLGWTTPRTCGDGEAVDGESVGDACRACLSWRPQPGVVDGAAGGIAEDPVRLVDRRHRHPTGRRPHRRLAVGMVLARQLPIGVSNLRIGRRGRHSQRVVMGWSGHDADNARGRRAQYPASTSTSPTSSSPRAKRRTFSVTRAASSGLAISGVLPTCGVMMQFGIDHSG